MATKDVRDILGLDNNQEPLPRPSKKAKKEGKPRRSGFGRELDSLIGDRDAPPSIVIQPGNLYKKRKQFRPTHIITWDPKRFVNQARSDGLMLKHWRKNLDPIDRVSTDDQNNTSSGDDSMVIDGAKSAENHKAESPSQNESTVRQPSRRKVKSGPIPIETEEYRFASKNYQVSVLDYDDEIYNTYLRNSDWSRKETDYLVGLYSDYYGKWPLIYDRWDFKPSTATQGSEGNADPTLQTFRERNMEELKLRYYEVAAKIMATRIPQSQMSAAEFERYETMLKFDPKQEAERKRVRELLLARSHEQKKEEEHLVAELRRIYLRQERFGAELKDLRERLDHSLTDSGLNPPQYQTSAEIHALFQKMLANDKSKRKPSIPQGATAASPSTAQVPSAHSTLSATPNSSTAAAASASGPAPAQKRGSITNATPGHRQLSPRSEARFGVSSHDRLTSGVTFRSDKLLRARQVKSSVQTQKISSVLAELGVPELLQMPTVGVCSAMEKLVQKVNLLLDLRKVREKEENEVAIARQQKALREGRPLETEKGHGSDKAKDNEKNTEKVWNKSTNQHEAEGASKQEGTPQKPESAAEKKGHSVNSSTGEAELSVKEEQVEASETSPTVSARQSRGSQTRRSKRSASVISASSTGSGVSRANSKRLKSARS